MGISPEHRPPLRPHCSRSEVALNGPAAVTDRIPPGPVHHLRHVSARRRDRERHLTAVEMKGALVHRDQRPVRDHAVDLGDPLHDPNHYLCRLDVSGNGLIVVGVEQLLVPDVEECPEVGRLLRMLPRQGLQ